MSRLDEDNPGTLSFQSFDPREISFWQAVGQQKLFVKLVGRRWFVTDVEWRGQPNGFIGFIQLRAIYAFSSKT
jgi:hypothetical protein